MSFEKARVRLHRAVRGLDQAGITYCLYQERDQMDEAGAGRDVDIIIPPSELTQARMVLEQFGFMHHESNRRPDHAFFLSFVDGTWCLLDVRHRLDPLLRRGTIEDVIAERRRVDDLWVAAAEDLERRRERGTGSTRWRRYRRWLGRRRPVALRRLGPVIAVVGPDGTGKGTLIKMLRTAIPVRTKALYFGFGVSGIEYARNAAESDGSRRYKRVVRMARRQIRALVPRGVIMFQYVLRCSLRNWGRLAIAYAAAWSGAVVLCDRHILDSLAVQMEYIRGFNAKMERAFARLAPWPDAVILLDAPAEEIFRRKQDFPVPILEEHRRRYAEFFGRRGATVITNDGAPDDMTRDASMVVWAALSDRRSW